MSSSTVKDFKAICDTLGGSSLFALPQLLNIELSVTGDLLPEIRPPFKIIYNSLDVATNLIFIY
jgi:hypothetical protein